MQNTNDNRLREVFQNSKLVLSQKQPPNILNLVSQAKFSSKKDTTVRNGLFKCNDKRCKLCNLYIQSCKSFVASNKKEWEIRTNIKCSSKNVIYYLSCNGCNGQTTYIGKTVDFRLRMNNHISSCRLGTSSNKFDNHVFKCFGHDELIEPYFKIFAMLKLSDEAALLSYESYLHHHGYDTLNQ